MVMVSAKVPQITPNANRFSNDFSNDFWKGGRFREGVSEVG